MQTFNIDAGSGQSTIWVDRPISDLESILAELGAEKVIVITDTNVHRHHAASFPDAPVITIGTGEKAKTLASVEGIYGRLIELEADRSTFIVGIGGGIVCDVAGFVASTFMRGVRFGFVATTLLAQVDASVGGKNGVNLGGYKNIVGVFRQPEFVLCDLNVLKSLSEHEVKCGLAEVVKHGLIRSRPLFEYLEENAEAILALQSEAIFRPVADSVAIKSSVVTADETESGVRRLLNFGHTFGHAFEKVLNISHGQAVSLGMVVAGKISVERNLLAKEDFNRLVELLKKLKLPVQMSADSEKIIDALGKDKKRQTADIHFVLLEKIGQTVVEKIKVEELKAWARKNIS